MTAQTTLMDWIQAELTVASDNMDNSVPNSPQWATWMSRTSALMGASSVAENVEHDDNAFNRAKSYYEGHLEVMNSKTSGRKINDPIRMMVDARRRVFEDCYDGLMNGIEPDREWTDAEMDAAIEAEQY